MDYIFQSLNLKKGTIQIVVHFKKANQCAGHTKYFHIILNVFNFSNQ